MDNINLDEKEFSNPWDLYTKNIWRFFVKNNISTEQLRVVRRFGQILLEENSCSYRELLRVCKKLFTYRDHREGMKNIIGEL